MSAPESDRAAAARALNQIVTKHRTSDQVIASVATPLGRDMLFGSLRYYCVLAAIISDHLERPLRQKDQDLWCLMIVGAYQLRHSRVPDHAAIHATVQACSALGKRWARSLVNAVLRAVQRDTERSFDSADYYPHWFSARVAQDYPDQAADVLAACLERAPQTLRINVCRVDPDEFAQRLAETGIASRPGFIPSQRVLTEPLPIEQLPGYDSGLVSVQDAGAGFAPQLLNPQPGQRLLDTCAAPGGKLFHLLEACPELAAATAVEIAPARTQHLVDEAARLGHTARVITADATTLDWWDGELFDHVLVDAPCSGSGTLRRHPEMKLLRSAADIASYQSLQQALLQSAWQTLRPGGSLLYCTCSLFVAENDDVISEFLAQTSDAQMQAISLPTGRATKYGWQLLPTEPRTDGFYYALLNKAATKD